MLNSNLADIKVEKLTHSALSISTQSGNASINIPTASNYDFIYIPGMTRLASQLIKTNSDQYSAFSFSSYAPSTNVHWELKGHFELSGNALMCQIENNNWSSYGAFTIPANSIYGIKL